MMLMASLLITCVQVCSVNQTLVDTISEEGEDKVNWYIPVSDTQLKLCGVKFFFFF